jgi:lipopolysaccharide export LptBFGC system permease protein LptF
MIETLVSLIVWLVIVGLIYWAVTTILGVMPIAEPIATVIRVLLIVVLCLIIIYALLPLTHVHVSLH